MTVAPSHTNWREMLGFALLAACSFLPFLGAAPLFDWDEINFAESAREMMVSGNYFQVQIDFLPFWEKPPLFIWLQVLSMKAFGVSAFAARLPNAIFGILTICSLYHYGTRLQNALFGKLVAVFYFISILPHFYFKSGIIDPVFNFFIFLGLVNIIRFEISRLQSLSAGPGYNSLPLWAGFWIGLATLTKGPVALIVSFLIYMTYKLVHDRKQFPWLAMLKFTGVYLLVILSWFGSIVLLTEDGMEIIRKFIVYQAELFSQPVAGHGQPVYYHIVVFLIGCFPLSAFVFRAMAIPARPDAAGVMKRFMVIWFWVVLVLFSIVETKIVHYSSLLYYPGAFLAAYFFTNLFRGRIRKLKWDQFALYGLGLIVFGILVGSIGLLVDYFKARASDPTSFAEASLTVDVTWTGWEFLPGLIYFLAAGLALYFLLAKRYQLFFATFLVVTPLYLNLLNVMVVPRIAAYSQGPAIEFFEAHAEEEAYIMVQGYKSYAHYFYGRSEPFPEPEIEDRGAWLARGPVDKPVYMVTRVDRASETFREEWFGNFTELYQKGGFVFFLRQDGPQPAPQAPNPSTGNP